MNLVARDVEGSYNCQQYVLTGVDVAGFSKVFSTMWGGSLYGRFEASAVFMVLLSLCNRDGIVDMTPEAIAGQTGWPIDIIRKGITELAAPDPRSRTAACDGRRIIPIDSHRDWGWRVTNYVKYRDEMRSQERKEYLRLAKQKERAVNKSQHVNQFQPIAEAEAEADINTVSADAEGFVSFWKAWPSHPRKVARKQCQKKWADMGCEKIAEDILDALFNAKRSDGWTKDGGAFIPSPLVWLNQARWEAPVVVKPDPVEVEQAHAAAYQKHLAASIAAMRK